jgi:NADPH2:quinone reductase
VVSDLGAEVVDYGAPGWERAAAELAGGPFDVTLDGVGGEVGRAAFGVTADGGRFSAHGAPSGDFAPVSDGDAAARGIALRGIRDLWFAPDAARRLTACGAREAAQGRLVPAIVRPLPLRRAADAHRVIDERRTAGKTLLLAGARTTCGPRWRSRRRC